MPVSLSSPRAALRVAARHLKAGRSRSVVTKTWEPGPHSPASAEASSRVWGSSITTRQRRVRIRLAICASPAPAFSETCVTLGGIAGSGKSDAAAAYGANHRRGLRPLDLVRPRRGPPGGRPAGCPLEEAATDTVGYRRLAPRHSPRPFCAAARLAAMAEPEAGRRPASSATPAQRPLHLVVWETEFCGLRLAGYFRRRMRENSRNSVRRPRCASLTRRNYGGFCLPGNRPGLSGLHGGGRSPQEPVCGVEFCRKCQSLLLMFFGGGPNGAFRSDRTPVFTMR